MQCCLLLRALYDRFRSNRSIYGKTVGRSVTVWTAHIPCLLIEIMATDGSFFELMMPQSVLHKVMTVEILSSN